MIENKYPKKNIEILIVEQIKHICRDNLFLAFGNTMSHRKIHIEERIVERRYNENYKFLNILYNMIFNPVHDEPICDMTAWYNKEDRSCLIIIDNIKDICKTKQIAKLIEEKLPLKVNITLKNQLYDLEDLNHIDPKKID